MANLKTLRADLVTAKAEVKQIGRHTSELQSH